MESLERASLIPPLSDGEAGRIKVLFLTKWFMNRDDPQAGVFIRKHATAAALYCDVALLAVFSDEHQQNFTEVEVKDEYGVKCFIVYFKKFSSSFKTLNKLVNFFRYIKASKEGFKKVKQSFGEHDITHAYIMLRPALVAYRLKLFKGKPFVISEQWSGYATGRFEQKNFFEKIASRWLFKKADAATAVSQFLKNKMIENNLNNKHFEITNNIVEIFPKKDSPLPARENIKMLCVADLKDEIKNISGIIKAVAEIVSHCGVLELHIVGHGPDEMLLKNLASGLYVLNSSIFFHGVKKNEEVFQYLYACDFLVMNSRFETFSLICAEAMACGKPVIATKCGGPQEFVIPETGILINPDSPEELRSAILKMMNDYTNYNSERLKEYVMSKFSADKIGGIFFSIYKEVLTH